ncbi:MAG: NAD(P)-dependent oxidoreductase, partial [Phycisphaeraceae bacterium]
MGHVLITGASGMIGRTLAGQLASERDIVCMSRRRVDGDAPGVRGDFARFEDLRRLDAYDIDSVVHMAAVTGGCSEADGLAVNVEGTRCLMRYLIDRGCRRFVLASSIAVVGLQATDFRPVKAPIPDEHPCLDRHGYGLSKYLMEEVSRYHARQNADLGVINLRLCSVHPDDAPPPLEPMGPPTAWAFGKLTQMRLSDACRAFTAALDAPWRPGERVMNAAPRQAWTEANVAQLLKRWYGDA